jgi:hypothetical protein
MWDLILIELLLVRTLQSSHSIARELITSVSLCFAVSTASSTERMHDELANPGRVYNWFDPL